MADALIINKADGENMKAANLARKAYTNALHLFPPPTSGWKIPVALCSAKTKSGIENIWEMICHFKEQTTASGFFSKQRQGQNLKWMYDMIHQKLESDFYQDKTIQQRLSKIENEVAAGKLSARHAVKSLFSEK